MHTVYRAVTLVDTASLVLFFYFFLSNSCALETHSSVRFASKSAHLRYLHLQKNTPQWLCEGVLSPKR